MKRTPRHDRQPAAARGRTQSARSSTGSEPRLPSERDESADSQAHGSASGEAIGRQGFRDLERGLQDTGTAPVTDRTYRGLREEGGSEPSVAPEPPGPPARRR